MGHSLRGVATTLQVAWEKDDAGQWYTFEPHNLDGVFGSGICVVWCEGEAASALFVGHGDLPQVLHEFYENRAVVMYRKLGTLRFSWAEAPQNLQRGAARFLTEQLRPVFEDTSALVPSVPVNLPQ
ncbi:MAG TPA: hypothetical protein VMU22_16120 [Rhizomicrobium sp.]|nr:hypothetical protein [Rhizomicrobium sp.]